MQFHSRVETRVDQWLRTLGSNDLVFAPYDMDRWSLEEARFKEVVGCWVLEFLLRGTMSELIVSGVAGNSERTNPPMYIAKRLRIAEFGCYWL